MARVLTRRIVKGKVKFTLTYNSYRSMIARCYDPRHPGYQYYGALGVTVDPEFLGRGGFQRFVDKFGKRPGRRYTMGRIDPFGHYTWVNMCWQTPKMQAKLKRHLVDPGRSHGPIMGVDCDWEF